MTAKLQSESTVAENEFVEGIQFSQEMGVVMKGRYSIQHIHLLSIQFFSDSAMVLPRMEKLMQLENGTNLGSTPMWKESERRMRYT